MLLFLGHGKHWPLVLGCCGSLGLCMAFDLYLTRWVFGLNDSISGDTHLLFFGFLPLASLLVCSL